LVMYEKCPVCGLEVLKGSKSCPACRNVLLDESKSPKQAPLDYQKQQVTSENPKKKSYSFSPPIDKANLYSCSACGHAVSRKAQECPSCGEPNPKAPPSENSKIMGSLLLLVLILLFIWVVLPKMLGVE
jgi:rubrerythrin